MPERHRRAWVVPLAVHEGVPGHYLQSWWWQRHFRAQGVAPSFVSFADPIAAERQDWGAMPAIEGWAVHAEDLLLKAGFHAIRCARAIVDVGLHTRGWSRDHATRMGIVGALVLSRPIAPMLYEISPADSVAYIGALGDLAGVAVGGSWFPALRATRVDPMEALRSE